jgi:cbb3-type cytochrome oxidase subunit 3
MIEFIAGIVIFGGIIAFIIFALKKKKKGEGLGEDHPNR